jgi:transposase-like protein
MKKQPRKSFIMNVVEKALNRTNQNQETLAQIAEQVGIGYSTLTRWMLDAKQGKLTKEPMAALAKEKRPWDWTAGEKLQAIVDTESWNGHATRKLDYIRELHLNPEKGTSIKPAVAEATYQHRRQLR